MDGGRGGGGGGGWRVVSEVRWNKGVVEGGGGFMYWQSRNSSPASPLGELGIKQ